jgi:hypothetical protein
MIDFVVVPSGAMTSFVTPMTWISGQSQLIMAP